MHAHRREGRGARLGGHADGIVQVVRQHIVVARCLRGDLHLRSCGEGRGETGCGGRGEVETGEDFSTTSKSVWHGN